MDGCVGLPNRLANIENTVAKSEGADKATLAGKGKV